MMSGVFVGVAVAPVVLAAALRQKAAGGRDAEHVGATDR